jgi:hypothetical protein
MARTFAEHATRVHQLLLRSERAQHALHVALAEFVREHGDDLGDDVTAAAALPKNPPPN